MKKKLLTPIMTIAALSTTAGTIATLTSCNKGGTDPEVEDNWYDLSKLNYRPSKQYNPESKKLSISNLMEIYGEAILKNPEIFKEDLAWSIQKSLIWKQTSHDGGRKIKTINTFKVKIDDLKLTDKRDTEQCIRFSCKYTYEIDLTYFKPASNAYHDVKVSGTLDVKNMPIWISKEFTADDIRLLTWKGQTYTVFFSKSFNELKDDDTWSFTLNESGTMTERDSGKISIKNYTWNKDTLALSTTPAISFFSSILFDFKGDSTKTVLGEKYANTYFLDISYYLDSVDATWSTDEQGGQTEDEGEEGEEAEGGEAEEEEEGDSLQYTKVLI